MKFAFVLFVNKTHDITMYVNIAYLVTAAKKVEGFDVEVFYFLSDEVDIALETIKQYGADIVGLSVTQKVLLVNMQFIKSIKLIVPDIILILGNIESTCTWNYMMDNYSEIDYIVKGEGEHTLHDLLNFIAGRGLLESLKGVAYRSNGIINENPNRWHEIDLDTLDFPDRSFMLDSRVRQHALLCARGCYGACTFCCANSIYEKNLPRQRSISNIIADMKTLQNTYHSLQVLIIDPIFLNGSYDSILALYNALLQEKFTFTFNFNFCCEMIDEKMAILFGKLRQVGLSHIFLGIESGNEFDLRLYGKKARLIDNERAIQLLREHNIITNYGFINFNPYTIIDRLQSNVDFIKKHKLFVTLSTLSSNLRINAGVPILNKLRHDGLINIKKGSPVYNDEDYKYCDERVGELQKMTCLLSDELAIKFNVMDYYILYDRYRRFMNDNDTIIFDNIKQIDEFISGISIDLFQELIDYTLYPNIGEFRVLLEKARNHSMEIYAMNKKIRKSILHMVKELSKQDRYVHLIF